MTSSTPLPPPPPTPAVAPSLSPRLGALFELAIATLQLLEETHGAALDETRLHGALPLAQDALQRVVSAAIAALGRLHEALPEGAVGSHVARMVRALSRGVLPEGPSWTLQLRAYQLLFMTFGAHATTTAAPGGEAGHE